MTIQRRGLWNILMIITMRGGGLAVGGGDGVGGGAIVALEYFNNHSEVVVSL